ncbi:unnamed protein product [Lymnaea stagnalis]|uniref:Serine/threonine-protein kinase greatwall n=1 Tax=Lymnaea stagnalis TaxID=6523 RepID=A0AAV2ILD0_LYMST
MEESPTSASDSLQDLDIKNKRLANIVQKGTATLASTGKFNLSNEYNPFQFGPKEQSFVVKKVDANKRFEEINAVFKLIEDARDSKTPRGLVLNPEKVSTKLEFEDHVDQIKNLTVLGKGAYSEVILVKDKQTGNNIALKTIMLIQFHRDQILAWIHLGAENLAPELYSFQMENNSVVMKMEVIKGLSLADVLDKGYIKNLDDSVCLSMFVLEGLLNAYESLRSQNFVHQDMHPGNVMIDNKLSVKLLDFDQARRLLSDPSRDIESIKNDIVGIIRIFCLAYSGYDFNDVFEAKKFLEAKNLEELSSSIEHIPEEQRKELYKIMYMLFESVRHPRQENFGDTKHVSNYVKDYFNRESTNMKKKLAVILFPEKFQEREEPDSGYKFECDSDDYSVWDDPDMDGFVQKVTDEDLRKLGVFSLF